MNEEEIIMFILIFGLLTVSIDVVPPISVFKEIDASGSSLEQLDNSTAQLPGTNASTLSIMRNLDIDEARGTFGSVQTDDSNVTWIARGEWNMISEPAQNNNDSSPTSFNATISLVTTNNSEDHEHNINSFQLMDGYLDSTTDGSTLVFNGTVSLETDDGLYTGVPISVKIMDESPLTVSIDRQRGNLIPKWEPGGGLISVWIDPEAIEDHFGNTPVYGGIRRP